MSLNRSAVVQPRPPAAELFEQARQLGKQLEIIHTPEVDIVVNHDAELAGHTPVLRELFKGGIPDTWMDLELTGADNANVFTATVDGQALVAKRRQWADGSADLAAVRQKKAEGITDLRHIYAVNSVLSEVVLAPKIKRLLQSREAETIISGFGFTRIEYAEPIIAYVIRATGEKGAVYGKVEESDWRFDRFPVGHFEDATKHLRRLLKEFGIRPMDFKSKHLLLDGQDGLHLIDTEMFHVSPD